MVQEVGPKVVRRSHPRGEKGTKVSIDEVVKRIEQGRKDEKTIAWARETVVKGGLAGFGANKMDQAKALLNRLRKERPYVEDPVDVEAMVSSACLLDGCNGLTFLGEDCDGLVVGFLSAAEAIGIEGAVVAHSYDAHLGHTHVLAAVYDRDRKQWVRCDPSTSQPFGTVSKPTRETFYLVPGGKKLCDSRGPCNTSKMGAVYENLRPQGGEFVGVGRPRVIGQVGEEPPKAEPVFPEVTAAFYDYMVKEVTRITDDLEYAWERVLLKHREYELVCEMLGYSLLETTNWTAEQESQFQAYKNWVPLLLGYGYDVSVGRRKVAWDATNEQTVILGVPGELAVDVSESGAVQIIDTRTGETVGNLGWVQYILIGGFILLVGAVAYGTMSKAADVQLAKLKDAEDRRNHEADEAARKSGLPEATIQKNRMERERLANEQARTDVEREKTGPLVQVSKTAEAVVGALGWVALAGFGIYALSIASDWMTHRKGYR